MTQQNSRISIQVGLSGYSFQLEDNGQVIKSDWMGPESVFTVKELQKRYSEVNVSVFTPYCALVPQNFYRPETSREQLSDVVRLPEDALVDCVDIPEFGAVLLYSTTLGGTLHKVISESVLMVDGNKTKPLPEMY